MKKDGTRKYDSIQWVIDALDNEIVEKKSRENHKTDEIRADENLWCVLNVKRNGTGMKAKYGVPQMLNYGMLKYVQIAIPLLN